MESIEDVIGVDRALDLHFDSRDRQLSAESWSAQLTQRHFDEDYEETDASQVVASATLVRVDLNDVDWFDSLDAESGDLAAIASAFLDRGALAEVDEDAAFADSLTIIDFVSVPKEHRGSRISHALVQGVGHILRSDIVALTPASISGDDSGRLFVDTAKQEALRKHWARAGFLPIGGSDVMLLPLNNRGAAHAPTDG
ncbi:hypothetical protein ABC270_07725 [Curtobacterium sp. 1P10AnD]|uniref:hypothetical protein n=1 Tax=Curtobacterium sp. 1P10AnD TaxID=3132283 RepID=UPI0039A0E517